MSMNNVTEILRQFLAGDMSMDELSEIYSFLSEGTDITNLFMAT